MPAPDIEIVPPTSIQIMPAGIGRGGSSPAAGLGALLAAAGRGDTRPATGPGVAASLSDGAALGGGVPDRTPSLVVGDGTAVVAGALGRGLADAVMVRVGVALGVAVGAGVAVGPVVAVGIGVGLAVGVGVAAGVGVGVWAAWVTMTDPAEIVAGLGPCDTPAENVTARVPAGSWSVMAYVPWVGVPVASARSKTSTAPIVTRTQFGTRPWSLS